MARLALTLLGGFQARLGAGPPLTLPTKKIQALLAYLALPPGREHARDKLAALLWGDLSQGHARHSLRQALFALRQAVAPVRPACLRIEGATIALNPDAVDIDAMSFQRLLGERTPEALAQAIELYRGDLLDGLTVQEPPFEEWLMADRERLRELAVEALAGLLTAQRAAGAVDPALQTGLRLIALDPLQESVHRTLMRLYAQLGRRGSALHQYQLCVGVLQRELGVEPEEETKLLYQEILRCGRPSDKLGSEDPIAAPPTRTPLHRLAVATDIPLIGREHEMVRLGAALEEVRREEGQVVILQGEAGVGKSRLIAELATEAMRDCRVLLGRCHEAEQILPFGPWVGAIRSGNIMEATECLRSLLPQVRSELARLLPELGSDVAESREGAFDALKLFGAVAGLLRQLAAREAVVLVLEDIHWADEMTLRLLTFVSHRCHGSPMLVVATAREEELTDVPLLSRTLEALDREAHVARLMLKPLSRPATAHLVELLARRGRETADLLSLGEEIWRTSEGNPFVVIETMRALDQGVPTPATPTLSLPERVREVIARRLDRLNEQSRQLVTVAAVIGREFEFALVQRAAEIDERLAAEGIEELVRRQLLQAVGDRFDFTHDRIRTAAYSQLLQPRRALCHRRVAEVLEELYASNLEPHAVTLGTHYREAKVWDKALRYLRRAGIQAVARSANREAVASFEQALIVLGHLPEAPETTALAIDLRLDLRNALRQLAELARMGERLREAELLARTLGDQRRLARIAAFMVDECMIAGDYDEAIRFGQEALSIARTLGDRSIEVVATFFLGRTHAARGEFSDAASLFERNVALEGDVRYALFGAPSIQSAVSGAHLAGVLAQRGRFDEAIGQAEAAVRMAEAADHPNTLYKGCLSSVLPTSVAGISHARPGSSSAASTSAERGRSPSGQRWSR
jgi:DNA-binding SARP family transcriptional activator